MIHKIFPTRTYKINGVVIRRRGFKLWVSDYEGHKHQHVQLVDGIAFDFSETGIQVSPIQSVKQERENEQR